MPCVNRMASKIPNVGAAPRLTAPSDPTEIAVVIISALTDTWSTESSRYSEGMREDTGIPSEVD